MSLRNTQRWQVGAPAPGYQLELPVALEFPKGIPYQAHVRRNVINLHGAGWPNDSISSFFHGRPCVRTVQEWVQRYKAEPNLGAPAPRIGSGGVPMLSQEEAYSLFILKCAMPTLSIEAAQQFFQLHNKHPSAATISREVTQRLAMSRKKLTHVSENRDEADRVKFQCNSPVDPDRPGICGAPVECFVSIDEKTLKYGECLPQFGHSPIGVPCVRRGPAPSSQPSYNVIIAVDVRVGVVAYLIYRGTLDRDTFYCWVALQVSKYASCRP
jgi:hypothetical protein